MQLRGWGTKFSQVGLNKVQGIIIQKNLAIHAYSLNLSDSTKMHVFSYLPSFGIAPCVGTAPYGYGTVTPPLDAALHNNTPQHSNTLLPYKTCTQTSPIFLQTNPVLT